MKLLSALLFLCISSCLFSQFDQVDTSKYASYRLSVRIANNRILADSNNAEAYIQRGYYRNLLRDFDGALRDIDKYISLKPADAPTYKSRAKVNYEKGDLQEAIKDINKAIELKPDFYEAINDRSTLYYKTGNYDACKADLLVLLKHNPNDLSPLLYLGYCETKQEHFEKAISHFKTILSKDSLYKEAWNNIGNCYFRLGDNEKALQAIDKAIQIDPRYPEAYEKRAQIKIAKKDGTGALEDLTKALSYNPFLTTSLNNRTLVYIAAKRYNEALGDINLLLQLVYPTPELLRTRAGIYKELGETKLMEEDLQLAELMETEQLKMEK